MEDTAQLRQSAIEKLIEVLDFIDLITVHPHKRETLPDALPAPDAFLECAGTWEFEPGELEEILQDADNLRVESWL
jgi:hypothetical protein